MLLGVSLRKKGGIIMRGKHIIVVGIFLASILVGGVIMSEAQGKPLKKPPVLGWGTTSSNVVTPQPITGAVPPPPLEGPVPPPPPPGGPVPPPPPPGGSVPPPPPGGVQLSASAGGWAIPDNALKAVEVAKEVKNYIVPGKIWIMRGPAGDMEIKAALVYQGVALDVLRFNPINGELLVCGFNPRAYSCTVSIEAIRSKLSGIIASLTVLEGAEYREPEACWVVPLSYAGKIVAHIKVYYDGIHVVPDYPATQEMNYYGR